MYKRFTLCFCKQYANFERAFPWYLLQELTDETFTYGEELEISAQRANLVLFLGTEDQAGAFSRVPAFSDVISAMDKFRLINN